MQVTNGLMVYLFFMSLFINIISALFEKTKNSDGEPILITTISFSTFILLFLNGASLIKETINNDVAFFNVFMNIVSFSTCLIAFVLICKKFNFRRSIFKQFSRLSYKEKKLLILQMSKLSQFQKEAKKAAKSAPRFPTAQRV